MNKKYLIVILGPTAIGKTSIAIEVAKELGSEIISADSRQFFKEMNIGTAKPSEEELKTVQHHFINSLSIEEEYNVGMYERDTLKLLDKIFKKKNAVVLAGGSGLYINAVCNGFDEVPPADKKIRVHLENVYKEKGIEGLRILLKEHDEEHYRKIDLLNPHRLIRAVEVCMITGKKYSDLRKKDNAHPPSQNVLTEQSQSSAVDRRPFKAIKIGLRMEREKLYKRINARVDEMMNKGLLEEVKSLSALRKEGKLNSLQTVGYKELFDFIDNKTELPRAIELIKQNTRNFAKRQMTWFRKDDTIKWFDADDKQSIMQFIRKEIYD